MLRAATKLARLQPTSSISGLRRLFGLFRPAKKFGRWPLTSTTSTVH